MSLSSPVARWPRRRLDPERLTEDRELLADVQGNIVRAHGRGHAQLVFFELGGEAGANRAALAIAAEMVTSAERQRRDALARKCALARGRSSPQAGFASIGLSFAGLQACGLADNPPPGAERVAAAFARGMAADHEILGDPPVSAWEAPLAQTFDGVWVLAGETTAVVSGAFARVHAWLQRCGGRVAHAETCFHWRPDPSKQWQCREPFGFADGISNPEFITGTGVNHWSNDISLDRVLIEDAGPHLGGSFLVVRKLEQNVAAFRAFEARLADCMREVMPVGRKQEAARMAESVIIGRDRDGTPLADLGSAGLNDFTFAGDDRAQRCPFHAHIRKANPRDDNPYAEGIAMEDARRFQFVRRSMVYGDPARLTLTGPEWPTGGVGLWFLGYMRDIEEQFREMQARWMRDPHFPVRSSDGLPDPLLFGGDNPGGAAATTWSWARDDRTTCVPGLAQFVRARGGEYFYVPSLRWLAAGGEAEAGSIR